MKPKKKDKMLFVVKSARKASREEEIKLHGKKINYRNIVASKKVYNRKRTKADFDNLQP